MDVAIIGGGAAGFFSAIHVRLRLPEARVVVFEKSAKVLGKVSLSGGGRCNLTNTFAHVGDLSRVYPRGHRVMKNLLREFGPKDTCRWFEEHGVPLVAQADDCVFPAAQDSAAIVGCLVRQAERVGVTVETKTKICAVTIDHQGWFQLRMSDGTFRPFQRVILTIGGTPHAEAHDWLLALGHKLASPCPSLFTFTIPDSRLNALMGIVVENVSVSIPGTRMRAQGPLLITHWGVSGPAILKLSSLAARYLQEQGYRSRLLIDWTGGDTTDCVLENLLELAGRSSRKMLSSVRPHGLQSRLWNYLLERAAVSADQLWGALGRKSINRLANVLTADVYEVTGKGSYKEEFVTCGGVMFESVESKTLESKVCRGLYFAGEVLDVDAITGGFNLQAAWTTAYVAARSLATSAQEEQG